MMKNIIKSSGNVFADLGIEEPDTHLIKAELSRKIKQIIDHRHLKQVEAAKLLGIDQPKVSKLLAGKVSDYSVERMFTFLLALDRDVTIQIKKKSRSHDSAHMSVAYA